MSYLVYSHSYKMCSKSFWIETIFSDRLCFLADWSPQKTSDSTPKHSTNSKQGSILNLVSSLVDKIEPSKDNFGCIMYHDKGSYCISSCQYCQTACASYEIYLRKFQIQHEIIVPVSMVPILEDKTKPSKNNIGCQRTMEYMEPI